MITLITGLPGASKTLNLLRIVDTECQGRPIYQYGITDLTLPWQELTLEQLHTWWELPQGSVICVDEAHHVWPSNMSRKTPPDSVTRMDTHRKGGYDFFIITQRPAQICSYLRGFAGPHIHYERIFGRNGAKEIRFEKCEPDTSKASARKSAQIQWRPFAKKYFDQFKSAELHTYKPKIPRVMYLLVAAVLFTLFMAYNLLSGRNPPVESAISAVSDPGQAFASIADQGNLPGADSLTPEQYAAQFKPRIEDVPHSAPAYDELTKVQSFPRPQCILRVRNNVCRCYTQQATPLAISHDACVNMVQNGYFNPYQPEQPLSQPGNNAQVDNAPAALSDGFKIVTLNDSTEYKERRPKETRGFNQRQVQAKTVTAF